MRLPRRYNLYPLFVILFFAAINTSSLDAQLLDSIPQNASLSNLKIKTFTVIPDTLKLDSLTVIPGTIAIKNRNTGTLISSADYELLDNLLVWKKQPNSPKGIEITYRSFPYAFSAPKLRKDTSWIGVEDFSDVIPYKYNPNSPNAGMFTYNGLDYTGSFARGISFGNNQDLVLNSDFNLQLSGDIGDEIEILAAISDNNIPLQPEGNTQQLQEFDQIFIQLKRRKSTLIAGDYQLSRPTGYFMNYFKRLQGASFNTEAKAGPGILGTRLSAAVARGQFARNTIIGLEGNQGPYKLSGNAGERFIIVLAGTEKVFIDGQLLTRGSEDDYIIDYNLGEVTFTANTLITKDKRITVEFGYTVDSYLRTLYGVNLEYKLDKFNVYFNQYSEQDGKNQTSGRELTAQQKQSFQAAGDQVSTTLFSSVDSLDQFDPNRIMYKLEERIVNGITYDSVFVYSTAPDSAKYVLSFTQVGVGMGFYNPVLSGANGRIYQWVEPDANGNLQGAFAPAIRLSSPERKQLYTLGASYDISKSSSIMAEVGLSNYDKNSFSDVNDDDNLGAAVKTGYKNKVQLNKNGTLKSFIGLTADYEFVQKEFEFIQPYRRVEFTRDWNTDNSIKAQEHLARAGFSIGKIGLVNFNYEFGTLIREANYTGFKHSATSRFTHKGFDVLLTGSYLDVKATQEESRFFRPKFDVSKTFKKANNLKLGVYGEREQNSRYLPGTDSLQTTSFYYDLVKAYINTHESEQLNLGASYTRRYDYLPKTADFGLATIADEVNFTGTWAKSVSSRLNWNLTYRNLAIEDSVLTAQLAQQTYLGRLEYQLNIKNGLIRSNTIYELGSGQQQRLEYSYIEAPAGQGTHTWIDRNEDGVPQQDEFETANFQDEANYIRFTTFTNDFIRTDNVLFSESFGINPSKIWRSEKKGSIKQIISRFATQSVLRINRKTLESDDILPWNPFQLNVEDTTLVSINSNIRNTLYYNRVHPKFGFEIGMSDNWVRTVLTTGSENRKKAEQSGKLRWNISKSVATNLAIAQGKKQNDSEFFPDRDYQIRYYKTEPSITWQPKKNFRAKVTYEFQSSKNKLSIEQAIKHDVSLELTYNKISKTEIRFSLSFADVAYTGPENTTISYAILEGLQNGKNYIWNLNFDRRISTNVLLSLGYDGRKTGEARIIHVGRASIRATF